MGPISLDGVSSNGFGVYTDISIQRSQASAVSLTSGSGVSAAAPATLSTTAVMVQAKVDSFLASFGQEIGSDQQLRMIIALLILNALLGRDQDQPTNRASELAGITSGLAGLASGLDGLGRRSEIAMFSATNIIQIQHQSTLVYSDQAIQTLTGSGGQSAGQDSSGMRLDVTG